MVYLTHKWKKNRKYLYLEEKARIDGKVKRVFQIYLGPEDKIRERRILMNIDKLKTRTIDFGSAVLWQIAEQIQLREILNDMTVKKRDQGLSVGDYLAISIINRCLSPCSKSQLTTWLKNDYLGFIYGQDLDQINSRGYWHHFQYFSDEIIEKIQSKLLQSVLSQFNIKLNCVLYDPTNFFTHQSFHGEDQLAKFGNSKEKRYDKRIVNISLVSSKVDAIPLWHQTYEGNTQDAKHFKSTIGKIMDFFKFLNYNLQELTLVFDRGNHSKEAFTAIKEAGLGIIVSVRKSSHKDKLQTPTRQFQFIELNNGKRVGYRSQPFTFHGVNGKLYMTYDRRFKKRSLVIFARKLIQKRLLLQEFIQTRLNQHKWKEKENVEKKLATLIGGNPFRDIFDFSVEGEYDDLNVTLNERWQAKARYCRQMGKSVIFTNRDTWSAKSVIQVYRDKYGIEDSFRQMKDPKHIALRPMYHYANLSIRVHVFSCILANLLFTLARKILKDQGTQISIKQLQQSLQELKVTEVGRGQLPQPIFQLNDVNGINKEISKIFDLKTIMKGIKKP